MTTKALIEVSYFPWSFRQSFVSILIKEWAFSVVALNLCNGLPLDACQAPAGGRGCPSLPGPTPYHCSAGQRAEGMPKLHHWWRGNVTSDVYQKWCHHLYQMWCHHCQQSFGFGPKTLWWEPFFPQSYHICPNTRASPQHHNMVMSLSVHASIDITTLPAI